MITAQQIFIHHILGSTTFPTNVGLVPMTCFGWWKMGRSENTPFPRWGLKRYSTFELASLEVQASTLSTACSRNLLPPSVWAPEWQRWSRAIPQPPDPWRMNKRLLLKAIGISVVFYIGKIRNQQKRLRGVILVECWKPPGDFLTYRRLYFWLMSCERCYFTIPQGQKLTWKRIPVQMNFVLWICVLWKR